MGPPMGHMRGNRGTRFMGFRGTGGGPRGGRGGTRGRPRGGRRGRGGGYPMPGSGGVVGSQDFGPTGNFSPLGAPQAWGLPGFGWGSLGGAVGRGGMRGSRGAIGGFHEESFESFQARCNPQALLGAGQKAGEAFRGTVLMRGKKGGVVRGWGATWNGPKPEAAKSQEPPVRGECS